MFSRCNLYILNVCPFVLASAGFYPVILYPFVSSVVLSIPELDVIGDRTVCVRLKSRGSWYLGLAFHNLVSLAHNIEIRLGFI